MPFTDRKPEFEENMPMVKIGNWAVPAEMESQSLMFRATYFLQCPSYFVAAGITNILRGKNTWESRVGPLSIGAYVFIGTMLLSFVQWYVVGIISSRLITKCQGR